MNRELRYPRRVSLRETAIAVFPRRLLAFYRRRRALRRYLRDLSQEVYQRQTRRQRLELDELEGRIVDRAGFYARLVKEVLRGIEEVLDQLDRRIVGIKTWDYNEIRSISYELV